MPRRENAGSRRLATREARPRILVVCGTAKTEEQYFRGLRSSAANRAVDVVFVNCPQSPLKVVRYALDYMRGAARDFDEVWCVFDVDQFDIEPAVRLARDSGISLGVSSPCFELWLVLHRRDCRSFQRSCREVTDRLRRCLAGYDKTRLRFADFAGGVTAAIGRAKALEPTGYDHAVNPSTSVWRLAEKIMERG